MGDELMLTTKEFLEMYVCKAGETILRINDNEWEIQKHTVRTFKTLGNIFAVEQFDIHPDESILKLKLTPKSRRQTLKISETLIQKGLEKGWLIEEVRFKKDGRTAESSVYRMGPGLFHYEQNKLQKSQKEEAALKEQLNEEIERLANILPDAFIKCARAFQAESIDQEGWGKERVRKFTHFLIAFLRLRAQKNRMDYKEIGATYYREIGGSKAFDAYREPFIRRLEKWNGTPVQELGITSLGFITPVHFTGELTGQYSRYSIGAVHTTNDIAVAKDHYQTNAKTLWLVENRAILTRMATEEDFLAETGSFILGVDGQIGGAHRKLIQQLCANSPIEKVMIWVDYDRSGSVIAKDLVRLIGALPYRLIGHEENVFTTIEAYENWVHSISDAEQEMTLGGARNWRKWIQL